MVLSILLPLVNDPEAFKAEFELLFGKKAESVEEIRKGLKTHKIDSIQKIPALEVLVDVHFRNKIAKFMLKRKQFFGQFFDELESFETRMQKIGKPKTWGGDHEIRAMSIFTCRRITVLQEGAAPIEYGSDFNDTIFLKYTSVKGNLSVKNHYHYLLKQLPIPDKIDPIQACKEGKIADVLTLLRQGLSIDTEDEFGRNLLQIAITSKQAELALELIKLGADLSHLSNKKRNTLHYAIIYQLRDIVPPLLILQIDLNQQSDEGNTPLHSACKTKNRDIIQLLLSAGANKELRNQDELRPVDCLPDDFAKTRALFKKHDSDNVLLDKLQEAIQKDDTDTFSTIIQKKPDLLAEKLPNGQLPLFFIVQKERANHLKNLKIDTTLLELKNELGITALQYATLSENEEMVKVLLNLGANINNKSSTFFNFNAWMMAIFLESESVTPLLFRKIKFLPEKLQFFEEATNYLLKKATLYLSQEGFLLKHEKLVKFLEFTLKMKIVGVDKLLQAALENDSVDLAYLSLKHGAIIKKEKIPLEGQVAAFLKYRPGKDQAYIYESRENFQNLYYDYLDTSSEESSEETSESSESLTSSDEHTPKKLKETFILYRGLHWNPQYFNQQQRREHAQLEEVGQPTFSPDTLKRAGLLGEFILDEEDEKLIEADSEVMQFFDSLETTEDHTQGKKRKGPNGENNFESLFYRFVQAYVTKGGYKYLFVENGIQDEFESITGDNPVISTTYLPDKAPHYAAGTRVTHDLKQNRLNPHYRRSTQKPKHSKLGVVYVYGVDMEYLWEHGVHILDLIKKKKVAIGHVQLFDQEIFFKSKLPGKFQIHREIFRMPSFAGAWEEKFESHYGYNRANHTKKKKEIADLPPLANKKFSEELVDLLNRITDKTIEFFGKRLEKKMAHKMAQEGKTIVYPFAKDLVSPSKLQPQAWKEKTTEIYSPLKYYERSSESD